MTTLGAPRYTLDLERLLREQGTRSCTRCQPFPSPLSARRSSLHQKRTKLPVSGRIADKMWDLLLTVVYEDDDDDDEKEYACL